MFSPLVRGYRRRGPTVTDPSRTRENLASPCGGLVPRPRPEAVTGVSSITPGVSLPRRFVPQVTPPGLVAGRETGRGGQAHPERRGGAPTRPPGPTEEHGGSVDLMEYQAKELFAKHDVPVTLGIVPTTPDEAQDAAEQLGVVVVKAEVKAGGRGKAGGVKLAKTPEDARTHSEAILGMEIKGLTVNRVLIAPAASIEEEYYFSFLLDRANRQYLCIASVEGGVEIEEVAKTNPDAVKQIPIDPGTGVDENKAREIVAEAKFPDALTDQAVQTVLALWKVFVEEDATLVEVNPLARLSGDKLEALDGKVSLDENADFRHEDHAAFVIREEEDEL